jgi:hypothetical protein
MSMHRASRAALSFLIVAVACLCAPPGALAQGTAVVTLRLVSQTPFTTPRHPILHVVIDAVNASDQALQDLSVGIQIGEPIRSRSQYLESMTSGPGTQPLFALPFPQAGSLDAGATRRFTVDLDVTTAHLSSVDSLVYPAQIDLRTGVTVVATLNTAAVHLVRTPEEPMRFAWWAELTSPPPLAPDGRLADPAFEASIAPGGSLASEVAALHHLATDPSRGQPIDVVVQPSMLDALVVMAGGYDRSDGTTVPAGTKGALDAANLLASLKATAGFPGVQVTTMPYSAPLVPSLVSSGLAPDLTLQRTAGDAVVSDVLGVKPVPLVARPPGGALNEASVDTLALGGATTLLADAETVTRPPLANDYAPLPTASLDTTAGNRVDLVLPDPDSETLLRDPTMATDPVRIAQVLFGLMAAIWRESPVPSPPTVRGVALGLPAGLPGLFWDRAIPRLADAPFLQAEHAQDFVGDVDPAGAPTALASPSLAVFSRQYVDDIHADRRDIDALRSMLVNADPLPDRLDRELLTAEAGVYVGNEQAGRAWIDAVHLSASDFFARAQPQASQEYTITSREGTIPLRMGDPGPTPMKLVVQLRSAWFNFPDGSTQTVTLDRPNQIISFRVEATAGSQGHPIQMLISAPSGRLLFQEPLVVRTAAVSRIALLITVLAAATLVVLWVRRIVRRRRSASAT